MCTISLQRLQDTLTSCFSTISPFFLIHCDSDLLNSLLSLFLSATPAKWFCLSTWYVYQAPLYSQEHEDWLRGRDRDCLLLSVPVFPTPQQSLSGQQPFRCWLQGSSVQEESLNNLTCRTQTAYFKCLNLGKRILAQKHIAQSNLSPCWTWLRAYIRAKCFPS